MNFLKQRFSSSSQVNNLMNSLKEIYTAEQSEAFAGTKVYGIQFLEFIDESNPELHDYLSKIFDIGKKIYQDLEASLPERANISSEFLPMKQNQSDFNKLRKQKQSIESRYEANKQAVNQKKDILERLEKSNGSPSEISKAKAQLNNAETTLKLTVSSLVRFNNVFDAEEQSYMKRVYELISKPLEKWAESEIKQNETTVENSKTLLENIEALNYKIEPDHELQKLLESLEEELK
ncbi:hypothetical protein TRFO_05881 [Tritrichomonas foetus]|uniref:BAR domain-containing protein n=1 Tax=Tritrichomonas foetus TaxID=1144522 RepID=A0A1J4K7Q6_9EUKA|nr:hypothetical protein TRFO_05881 [Tritrichomonas foetus]|eukprot:OHT05718.1 hypothetical protein TRFO_05881 [Tritrichomonas foetus]